MSLNRSAILLIGLFVLVISNAYALSVVANPSPIAATVSKSNPVVDFTANITLDTNDDAVAVSVVSSNPNIGISGPTYVTASGTYQYHLLFPSTPGTYTGTVMFHATGSSNAQYQVSFNVAVTAWESKYKDYFEKGTMYKVTVGSNSYLMQIKDLSDSAVTLYFDGATYTIAEGDSDVLNDNLKVKVDEIFSSGAVLELFTQGDSVQVAKYEQTTSTTTSPTIVGSTATIPPEALSGFTFLIAKYSKYIQQNMTYTMTVTLVNNTNYRIALKNIYFVNTTVTPEGEKPTRLEDYQMPAFLDPGQELTLKVTIDTRGLEVGKTYTPSLIAVGSVGRQEVKAECDFYITVVKGVQTGNTEKNTQTTTSQTTHQTTPQPKPMTIQLIPSDPQPGDTVTIYVRDAKTNDFVNAQITVNGQPTSTFTADWCKTYRITAVAQGYLTATKVVHMKCKTMNVTYSPQNPTDGDTVTFTVTDASTGQPINAEIRVDGQPISGTTWVAKKGTHTVSVTAEEYSPRSIVINVKPKPIQVLSQIPATVSAKQEVNISLSAPAQWEVYDQNNVLIASGNSDKISFSPPDAGTYTIKVNGKEIGQVKVTEPLGAGFSGLSGNIMWYLAGAGLLLIVYDAVRKRKKTSSSKKPAPAASLGFDLRPKNPSFAVPQNQEGGNE